MMLPFALDNQTHRTEDALRRRLVAMSRGCPVDVATAYFSVTGYRALEGVLATLVEDIYALTPEERRLLRETRPVRDPLDVLDGLIAGRAEPAVVASALEVC